MSPTAAMDTTLRWSVVDFKRADMAVNLIKNDKNTRHPLQGDDLSALRTLYRQRFNSAPAMSVSGAVARAAAKELSVSMKWPRGPEKVRRGDGLRCTL